MSSEQRRAIRTRSRRHEDAGAHRADDGQSLSVQRDGATTLQPPSLLQQSDPASKYHLGNENQLQLDPALLASMRQLVEQQLDPLLVLPALAQAPVAGPATPNVPSPAAAAAGATSGDPASAGAVAPTAGSPTPAPAPAVPAGNGPDTARPASPADLGKAIMALPAVDQALSRLKLQASEQVARDWSRLSTGERTGVVSSLAVIGLGALTGIASDPAARSLALSQLNGRPVPVPGLDWMHVEVNTAGENIMVGLHVDVGRLLPPSLGFGPGSPNAIGGPPQPQPLPGQRAAAPGADATDVVEERELPQRILDARGNGKPLDDGAREHLESTLGADFGSVRVHTGGEADSLARGVDAVAFTTGRDIFFREGAYAPGTPEGLKLLAHEATHTAQQAAGPVAGRSTPSGIALSTPGDPFERSAERAADQVGGSLGAGPLAAPHRTRPVDSGFDFGNVRVANVQRQPATATKKEKGPTGYVGGESDSITFLPGPAGQEALAPGEAGYSIRMLQETSGAAEKKTGLYADAHLTNVVPYLGEIDNQLKQRAVDKQRLLDETSGWAGPSTNKRYTDTADWCQQHMGRLESDRSAEEEKTAQYNAWVPRANGFFTSLTRLEAMQEMLGVKDPASMALALTQGLKDAEGIGERAEFAHAGGKGGETLDVPAVDDTLTDLSSQTTQASREMNTAWLGFQQNALADRATAANAEGDADRNRMAEINEVKTFVRNVGKTVDVTMSVVSGAPAAVASATSVIQKGEATLNAHRNKKQIMAGERPTHNPTYVTMNEKGEMIVRNVQTGSDRPIEGGESTPTPETSFSLPTSVSDLLGTIADFAYAGEVKEINMRLEAIKSRCDAINGVAELLKIREKAQNFQDKLNAFAQKCYQLQNRMAQRRQTYLNFGIQLDNFARKDAAAKAAGTAPKGGEERFATIMTVVSQVREVLAIGTGARDGFMTSDAFATWARGVNERRTEVPVHTFYRDGTYYPNYFKLPDTEWKPLANIYGQIKAFESNVGMLEGIFKAVEAQSQSLMGKLHPGGGTSAY